MTRGSTFYDEKEREREKEGEKDREKKVSTKCLLSDERLSLGERADDLVLHPETIVNHSRTDADGWRKQAPRVVLLFRCLI